MVSKETHYGRFHSGHDNGSYLEQKSSQAGTEVRVAWGCKYGDVLLRKRA